MLVAFTDKNRCFPFMSETILIRRNTIVKYLCLSIPIVFSELLASVVFDIYIDDFSSPNFSGCYVTQEKNSPKLINDPTDI